MYILQLNDSSRWNIVDNVEKFQTTFDGAVVSAIRFQIADSTNADIITAFKDSFNTREMSQYSESNSKMASFIGYTKCKRIARDEVVYDESAVEVFEVTMMQPSDLTDTVKLMESKIASLENQILSLTAEPDPATMDLADLQEYLIMKSKEDLEAYLLAHPITSSCHGGVEKQYSVTEEKQQILNQAIALANIAISIGDTSYQPSYNATGEECTYDWTLEELVTLAFEINRTVRPLISRQQSIESRIMNATTTGEALAIEIRYDDVEPEAVPEIIPDTETPVTNEGTTTETTEEQPSETPVTNEGTTTEENQTTEETGSEVV